MKQKKESLYVLKSDVRFELKLLRSEIDRVLEANNFGFENNPGSLNVVPCLFRFYSHWLWCKKPSDWFKKVWY